LRVEGKCSVLSFKTNEKDVCDFGGWATLAEFDFQWAEQPSPLTEYFPERVQEFLTFTQF